MNNSLSFEVWGANALFSDPLTRGGEKATYEIPTYQALVGIASSVYWKPTFLYVIDKVRIMNIIRVESKAMRPLDKRFDLSRNTLAYYTYLRDVRYQVSLHIEWNMQREDLAADRNIKKHEAIFNRALKAGGRRDIFLGTRECQGYVKPQVLGEGQGYYDNAGETYFGTMVHGFNYPDETGDPDFSVRLWQAKMTNGVVTFPRPDQVSAVQTIRPIGEYEWMKPELTQSVDELYHDLMGGDDQ